MASVYSPVHSAIENGLMALSYSHLYSKTFAQTPATEFFFNHQFYLWIQSAITTHTSTSLSASIAIISLYIVDKMSIEVTVSFIWMSVKSNKICRISFIFCCSNFSKFDSNSWLLWLSSITGVLESLSAALEMWWNKEWVVGIEWTKFKVYIPDSFAVPCSSVALCPEVTKSVSEYLSHSCTHVHSWPNHEPSSKLYEFQWTQFWLIFKKWMYLRLETLHFHVFYISQHRAWFWKIQQTVEQRLIKACHLWVSSHNATYVIVLIS